MTAHDATIGARQEAVALPDFGMPAAMPELPSTLYAERLARLRERADAGGHQRLVIYADREHSAIGDHVVERLATTPALQADVRRAVGRSLELWWGFFDGIAAAIAAR